LRGVDRKYLKPESRGQVTPEARFVGARPCVCVAGSVRRLEAREEMKRK
jgi:hypothetical protein